MRDPTRFACAALALALLASPSLAQDDADADEFGEDLYSPEEISERETPRLVIEPVTLAADLKRGEDFARVITITNGGGGTLQWSASTSERVIRVGPSRGTLSPGEKVNVTIAVRSDMMPAGGVTGDVTFVAEGAADSPGTVELSISIDEPAGLKEKPLSAEASEKDRPINKSDETDELDTDDVLSDRASPPRLPTASANGNRFGVRAGYLGYGSVESVAIGGAPLLGLFYGNSRARSIAYEAGVDFAQSEAENESFTNTVFSGHFDLLFALGNPESTGGAYLVSGLAGFLETVDDVNTDSSNSASALNLGAGVGLAGGKIDIRATYSVMLGSDNATGLTLVSAALAF